jgi:hypothetical protein
MTGDLANSRSNVTSAVDEITTPLKISETRFCRKLIHLDVKDPRKSRSVVAIKLASSL